MGRTLRRTGRHLAAALAGVILNFQPTSIYNGLVVRLASFALAEYPQAQPLRSLPSHTLVGLVRRDPATASVILGRGYTEIPVGELMAVATQPELAFVVAQAVSKRRDAAVQRSTTLYQIIALGTRLGRSQVIPALMVVAAEAQTISTSEAAAILRTCLNIAAQRVNPYEPPGIIQLAKAAATTLLQEHPELDGEVHSRLRPHFERAALEVIAVALRARPAERPSAVVRVLQAWRPSVANAASFARECDSRSRAVAIDAPRPLRLRPSVPGATVLARKVGPFLVAPAIAVISAYLAGRLAWSNPPFDIGLAEILIAFGVLITVHIVAAELSATRLPGVLARHTSFPPSLWLSYGAATTLLLASGYNKMYPSVPVLWSTNILTALLGGSVFLVMVALLRRTDPATAVEDFVKARRDFNQNAGSDLGKLRRQSEAFRDLATSLSYVRMVMAPAKTERRSVIQASRRGLFVPSGKRLVALQSSDFWTSGRLAINVAATVGVMVNRRDEIGAVVPDYETAIPKKELRRAVRVLTVQQVRDIEQVGEAVGNLVEILNELALHGNAGGAERVGQAMVSVLSDHMAAVRAGKDRYSRGQQNVAPVIPALKTCISSLMSALAHAQNRTQAGVLVEVITNVLRMGVAGDDAPALVMANLSELSTMPSAATDAEPLLRAAGLRCLETFDRLGLTLVQREIEERLGGRQRGQVRSSITQIAAELCANAAWLEYRLAPGCWRWYWGATQPLGLLMDRVLGAIRIGSAALMSGTISLAVDVALRLRESGVDLQPPRNMLLANSELVAREQAVSDLGGGYLGTSAGDALLACIDFCTQAAAAIA